MFSLGWVGAVRRDTGAVRGDSGAVRGDSGAVRGDPGAVRGDSDAGLWKCNKDIIAGHDRALHPPHPNISHINSKPHTYSTVTRFSGPNNQHN
jgi:hypothetical protein